VKLLLFLLMTTSAIAQIDWQGHRGARGLAPENTLPAFKKALEYNISTLELDVVISKDRQVVVSHEAYFNPDISTDPNGDKVTIDTKNNLFALNYADIASFDVGKRGNPKFPEQVAQPANKPLLSEVLALSKTYPKVKFNIELKSEAAEYGIYQPFPEDFCQLVYDVLKTNIDLSKITIQSFDFNILKHWKNKTNKGDFEKVILSALIEPLKMQSIAYNLEALGFVPDVWSPYFARLSTLQVKKLHSRGIKVIPWTVNSPADMQKMLDMGVDGIITDYPNRIPN
jgi:glycerophosphoryl diester phosphodiesterase